MTTRCTICGDKVRNSEPVCKLWKCEYYYASERAIYWANRAGNARGYLNMSSDVHVDSQGCGVLSMNCKVCDKQIATGCGDHDCSVLCPWCVCDSRKCRKTINNKFDLFNNPRRCFARGCEVIVPTKVLSLFEQNKDLKEVITEESKVDYISCTTCLEEGRVMIYCESHKEHYYHCWRERESVKNTKQKKRRKKNPPNLPDLFTVDELPLNEFSLDLSDDIFLPIS